MAHLADLADLWCRVFGYSGCHQLSAFEASLLIGVGCLAAVFGVIVLFGVVTRSVT